MSDKVHLRSMLRTGNQYNSGRKVVVELDRERLEKDKHLSSIHFVIS